MSNRSRKSKGAGLVVAALGFAALAGLAMNVTPGVAAEGDAVAEHGAYLVRIGGCNDCHTPLKMGPQGPAPDMDRLLAGHPAEMPLEPLPKLDPASPWNGAIFATATAFAGPWGVSVARNLTPDDETGLGLWSEEQFVRAMRTGQHQGVEGGRPILPPMPWPAVAAMTDEDLHAVWSYLRSIPAVANAAPQSIPAPPPGAH